MFEPRKKSVFYKRFNQLAYQFSPIELQILKSEENKRLGLSARRIDKILISLSSMLIRSTVGMIQANFKIETM